MKFSIITVCKNAESSIERTILSVINQTYDDIEYIIIDGESKDETITILKKYENNINVLISEPDNGVYDAMNKGINLANGEIVCFLNAGDHYLNDNVIDYIAKRILPEAEIVYSDMLTTDLVSGQSWHISYKDITHKQHLFNSDGFAHCCTFYRMSVLKKIGTFNSSFKIFIV